MAVSQIQREFHINSEIRVFHTAYMGGRRSTSKDYEKLKAAWIQRQQEGIYRPDRPTYKRIAYDVGHLIRDDFDPENTAMLTAVAGQISQYLNSGLGSDEKLKPAIFAALKLPADFLSNPQQKDLPALVVKETDDSIDTSTNLTDDQAGSWFIRGGSGRVWVAESEDSQIIEAKLAAGENLYLQVNNNSLRGKVDIGRVVVFLRASTPREDKTLLIAHKTRPNEYAIRDYDPDALEGEGGYVSASSRETLDPLPFSDWAVKGFYIGCLDPDGTKM